MHKLSMLTFDYVRKMYYKENKATDEGITITCPEIYILQVHKKIIIVHIYEVKNVENRYINDILRLFL